MPTTASLRSAVKVTRQNTTSVVIVSSSSATSPSMSTDSKPPTAAIIMDGSRCKRKIDFLQSPERVAGRVGKHPRKSQTPSVVRRNERERNRVKMVNSGFAILQKHVPGMETAPNKKLSKVDTLRGAVDYIRYLQSLLDDNDALEHLSAAANSIQPQAPTSSAPPLMSSSMDCYQRISPIDSTYNNHCSVSSVSSGYASSSPLPLYTNAGSPAEYYPSQASPTNSYHSPSSGSYLVPSSGYSAVSDACLSSSEGYSSSSSGVYSSPTAGSYISPSPGSYASHSSHSPRSDPLDSLEDADIAVLTSWIV